MTDSINTTANPRFTGSSLKGWIKRLIIAFLVVVTGAVLIIGLMAALALSLAYPQLPDLDAITDYRPKVPLRVFTADGVLIGEFGEERRNVVRIKDVPDVMKSAILAAEDDRFYQHSGIDYQGILRAGVMNIFSGRKQGASTITQQVARNFYLSSEQTYARKIYEVLLSFKIESSLTKDQILELYINQIYLGQRAYGFASAAQIYFGKSLRALSPAEAAMLAGLPKAPSQYNPVVNPKRAKLRQQYILDRMHQLGYMTNDEHVAAKAENVKPRAAGAEFDIRAEYVAELARQMVYETYKEETYTRGLNVITTLLAEHQSAAYDSLRKGVLDYDKRHGYKGPEAFIELPPGATAGSEELEDNLVDYSDFDNILSAVVLEATPKLVRAARAGELIEISGEGLKFCAPSLSDKAQPQKRIRRGAIIRVIKNEKGAWEIIQMPEVESAFVAANHSDGAIRAMVGGFDFNRAKFNHVTQAWRQPGSSFKPFIYSSSLEKGFTPQSVINDTPFIAPGSVTGGAAWEPKNYDGKFDGPMPMRTALQRSKNMVSIRILEKVGPKYAQDWITRFGFEADKHPAYLTMALGAGSVTPLQMLGGYSVFANGGYRVNPYLIERVQDQTGKILMQAKPAKAGDETVRVIDARNAFIMDSLMRDVVRKGTATRALQLKRADLAGKTGTTNDAVDAWFAGYSSTLVGIAWIGFDQPKSLGDRETGGGGALPIWMGYMGKALKGVPERKVVVPSGISGTSEADWAYTEFSGGNGVGFVGGSEVPPTDAPQPADMPVEPSKEIKKEEPPGKIF